MTGSCKSYRQQSERVRLRVVNDISIGVARHDEIAQVPKIEFRAATLFPAEDLPDAVRYGVTDRRAFLAAQCDERLWVARSARGAVVGFALADEVDGEAHLDEIGVLPEFGRRGIGASLVSTVAGWAAGQGYRHLTLITFRHLAWNAPFYERCGFVAIDEALIGPELTALLDAEAREGIDRAKRVCLRLDLQSDQSNR